MKPWRSIRDSRSAVYSKKELVVPRYRLTTAGRRAFSCAGPSAWNSLPEYLTVDTLTLDYFERSLKCFLFARYWHNAWSALGICNDRLVRYINVHLIIINNNKKRIGPSTDPCGTPHVIKAGADCRGWRTGPHVLTATDQITSKPLKCHIAELICMF